MESLERVKKIREEEPYFTTNPAMWERLIDGIIETLEDTTVSVEKLKDRVEILGG